MYPKKKYAPTGGFVEVNDVHHERALGPGWSDNPPAPVEPAAKPAARKAKAEPEPAAKLPAEPAAPEEQKEV